MSDTESYGPLNGRPAPMSLDGLKRILAYNPETGGFTWLVSKGRRVRAGSLAGSVKDNGYVVIKIDGVFYKAHRLAWFMATGDWPAPDIEIDHINRQKGDNRLCNLRPVTRIGNRANIVYKRVAKPKPPKAEGPRKYGRGHERPAPMGIDEMRALLTYDPDTGLLRWARRVGSRGKIPAGAVAGGRSVQGYVVVRLPQGLYPAHRLAWYIETGEWVTDGLVIDHINGVKDDNRWDNLRLATQGQNGINRPTCRPNTSGYRGVIRVRGQFRAQIKIDGRLKVFPQRATAEEAYADYVEASRVHHREFGRVV